MQNLTALYLGNELVKPIVRILVSTPAASNSTDFSFTKPFMYFTGPAFKSL